MGKRFKPRQQNICMSVLREIPIAEFSMSLNSIEKLRYTHRFRIKLRGKTVSELSLFINNKNMNKMSVTKQSVGIDVSKDTLEVMFKEQMYISIEKCPVVLIEN